jgi:hypothetical protein
VGSNELLLVALIHRLLIASSRNGASSTGSEGSAKAFEGLSRHVRESTRRRDFDAVEAATVEHYLNLIGAFLP